MGVLQQSKIPFPNKQVKLDVVSCMALNFDYGLVWFGLEGGTGCRNY